MNTNFLQPREQSHFGKTRKPIQEKFWSHVKKTKTCWIWIGARLPFGHGVMGDRMNGRYISIKAHRLSWEIHNGIIPAGVCVLHRCDNPWCVNPKHLYLGNFKDNTRDAIERGRMKLPQGKKGSLNVNAKLNERDIPVIRQMLDSGWTQNDIAKSFRVTKRVIWMIAHNITWQHVA